MRGILLAGGLNTRLRPATLAAPKSLMPVWDAPLIYHPLCALMGAGAREILVIASPEWVGAHRRILGDGSAWGLRISHMAQRKPLGIADAYRIGGDFLRGGRSALALCDNLFLGGFERTARQAALRENGNWRGAAIFVKEVADPRRFGVAVLGKGGRVLDLEEKPKHPKSSWAATGFYLCDGEATRMARELSPSARGELEITDLLRGYMERGELRAAKLGKNTEWFDAGTPDDLARATNHVGERSGGVGGSGKVFGSPELTALRMGWMGAKSFRDSLAKLGNCDYARRVLRAGNLFLQK